MVLPFESRFSLLKVFWSTTLETVVAQLIQITKLREGRLMHPGLLGFFGVSHFFPSQNILVKEKIPESCF